MLHKKILTTALAVLAAGLFPVAVGPPAGAWSATLQYTCSGPGFGSAASYPFAAVFETDVPATLPYGSERATAWGSHLFAPESFREWATSQGFTTLYAGVQLVTAVDGAEQKEMSQGTRAMAVPTSQQTWTWDPTPTTSPITASTLGQHSLSVTSLGISVAFYDASGPRWFTTATCVLAPGSNATVDTYLVVAATTATTLAVTGDTATATVTSNGTPPVGVVTFSVGGKTVAMDVSGGKATAKLPTVLPGVHQVSATFVPSQPTQLTSSGATASYTVQPIATRTKVSAVYRPDRDLVKTRARVTAPGEPDVSGRVTFVLKRNGRTLANLTVRLSGEEVAVRKFRGITKAGRYLVVARYLGTSTHQQSRDRVRLTLR